MLCLVGFYYSLYVCFVAMGSLLSSVGTKSKFLFDVRSDFFLRGGGWKATGQVWREAKFSKSVQKA